MKYFLASIYLGDPPKFGVRMCTVEIGTYETSLIAITFYVNAEQHITQIINSSGATLLQVEIAREFLRAGLVSERLEKSKRESSSTRPLLRRELNADQRRARILKQLRPRRL